MKLPLPKRLPAALLLIVCVCFLSPIAEAAENFKDSAALIGALRGYMQCTAEHALKEGSDEDLKDIAALLLCYARDMNGVSVLNNEPVRKLVCDHLSRTATRSSHRAPGGYWRIYRNGIRRMARDAYNRKVAKKLKKILYLKCLMKMKLLK